MSNSIQTLLPHQTVAAMGDTKESSIISQKIEDLESDGWVVEYGKYFNEGEAVKLVAPLRDPETVGAWVRPQIDKLRWDAWKSDNICRIRQLQTGYSRSQNLGQLHLVHRCLPVSAHRQFREGSVVDLAGDTEVQVPDSSIDLYTAVHRSSTSHDQCMDARGGKKCRRRVTAADRAGDGNHSEGCRVRPCRRERRRRGRDMFSRGCPNPASGIPAPAHQPP